MKVLLTATVQSHIVQFHRPLVELLHEHGFEVHVAARNNLAEKNGLTLDFADRVFDIPFNRSPKSPENLRAYRRLKTIIDEGGYGIIHCNTPVGGIVTRLAARDARKQGAKVFYTAHGFHFYKGAPRLNWLLYYPIEAFFARHFTDKLLTVTAEDYKLARERFACEVARIHGVGVDDRRFYPVDEAERQRLRREMGFAPGQKLLLCIGELLPNKNQMMAIRMMPRPAEQYPDALLLLAGNGPEREHLEREIEANGLGDRVRLLGYVTNLQEYQRVADVLVACSHREGLPLNVVEAMLTGTPVVATDNRGHRELIADGQTGRLVPKGDADAMARAVEELLGDEALRKRLADGALQKAGEYTCTAVIKELERVYFGEEADK